MIELKLPLDKWTEKVDEVIGVLHNRINDIKLDNERIKRVLIDMYTEIELCKKELENREEK